MKSGLLLILFFIFTANQLIAQIAAKHSFVCTDYTQGLVCIISEEGKLLWQYTAPDCNDLWVLPNENLLFNTGHGVKEVSRNKKVVFDYQSNSKYLIENILH